MGKGNAGHRKQRSYEVILSWQAVTNSWAQSLSKDLEIVSGSPSCLTPYGKQLFPLQLA